VCGMSERQLMEFTGSHEENPTMDVPSRYVFEHSQKKIQVIGPVEEVLSDIFEPHRHFWSRNTDSE